MTALRARYLLSITLVLALALAGLAAAAARGQTRAGDQLLALCSSGGLVQVATDAEGRPTGRAHICPDLALSLLAGPVLAPLAVPMPATAAGAFIGPVATSGVSAHGVPATARAPPVPV